MSTGLNFNSIKLNSLAAMVLKRYGKHIGFAAVIIVLLVYVIVVLKINTLSQAQVPQGQAVNPSALAPHVNQQAIDRIQALENNSPQIHSLFEQARNNPFQE